MASPFTQQTAKIAAWIAQYRDTIRRRRVLSNVRPGDVRQKFSTHPPTQGRKLEDILQTVDKHILPGMTHWNHPRFFAYFSANNSEPSILAEMITAAIGAQCMSWQTSPAATELEQVVMGWLSEMLDLPPTFTGVIHDSASSGTLAALLMARERATQGRFKEHGAAAVTSGALRVYASSEAHSSIDKGVALAGFGQNHLVRIETDDEFAMKPDALRAAIEKDLRNGFQPACVVATVGTTSSTANDPLAAVGVICREFGVFLHVDGAFSGNAAILPEKRHFLHGLEFADTFLFNPHKWMFTNFDCTAFFVQDIDLLLSTFSIEPEYLRTPYDPEVVNFRDWGIPLGRRFRALKLWWVIEHFGVEGLQRKIREGIHLAQLFAEWVKESPSFELMAPTPVSLVCFRWNPGKRSEEELEKANQALLAKINASGEAYLTHTKLKGKYVLRFNTSQEMTTEEDVRAAWNLIERLTT